MPKFLVEEERDTTTGETITFHIVVEAETAKQAFTAAENLCGHEFYFSRKELKMWVRGYAWEASDGSSVAYTVRKLED